MSDANARARFSRSTLGLTIARAGTMLNNLHVGKPTVEQVKNVCLDSGLPIPPIVAGLETHPLIMAVQLAGKPDVGHFYAMGAFENAVDHMRKIEFLDE